MPFSSTILDPYDWPVLKRYEGEYLRRLALPVGGIGTGTVSLGGRGDWRDWEVVNRPAKGFVPPHSFFCIRAQNAKGGVWTRALEGAISPHDYEGARGCTLPNHGLPRFREAAFEAAYPFGQVLLCDDAVPFAVRLQAFNPFVPADAEGSGLPIAVARFVVANLSDEELQISICGNEQNFVGTDGKNGKPKKNFNEFRQTSGCCGVLGQSNGVDPQSEQWGSLAMGVLTSGVLATENISHRTSWANLSWGDSLLDFWDDFSDDGKLEDRALDEQDAPYFSLCASTRIAVGATQSVTFVLAWHFSNRLNWSPQASNSCCGAERQNPDFIGNHYATQFENAWDVIEKVAPRLPDLEASTLSFVRAFCDSDLPEPIKEAALFNLSTLRSQTCFRTGDGHFFGWEGCDDNSGCCEGSCTHVWNYEQATAFLFGELSRSMREVEFLHATHDNGLMSFRVNLPLSRAQEFSLAAADGQMGCVMKLLRDWQLSGDDEWLATLWPRAKKALEFCWIDGGWDADRDGVMEGCQHNTMDVEYYGPNPQMQGWYLGALRSGEEMAKYLGDDEFASRCRELFENGARWTDAHLWNGEYYEHEIRPITDEKQIAPGLRHPSMGAKSLSEPELQLGAGCLIDQLVGQYMAHVCGLGYLHEEENVRATLRNILKHNRREDFHNHFNHMRSYVLGDESAVLMATYPHGRRPARPFPYCNEVMTGFEHTLAAHLIYEGELEEAVKVIEAIRARYDGRKRSPFDEAECGHHYARAMASWAQVLAWTGFEYSAVQGVMKFRAAQKKTKWFWSNGWAWGTFEQAPRDGEIELTLRVEGGVLALQRLELREFGVLTLDAKRELRSGEELSDVIQQTGVVS